MSWKIIRGDSMLINLMLVAAFLFFILERKVRFSVIPGTLLVTAFMAYRIFGILTPASYGTIPPNMLAVSRFRLLPFFALATAILIAVSALVSFCFFYLGRLISRPMFKLSNEPDRNNRLARTLYLICSIQTGVTGLYMSISTFAFFSKRAGSIGMRNAVFLVSGLILLITGIVCTVVILTNKSVYKKIAEGNNRSHKKAFTAGIIISVAGNLGIWIVAALGLISSKEIDFFTGSMISRLISMICIYLLSAGIILLMAGITGKKEKGFAARLAVSILLVVISLADYIWLFINAFERLFQLR